MMNNAEYAISTQSFTEIPSLEIEATKASAGYWWTPITVNITERLNKQFGQNPVGKNIIIEVTSSKLHGYSTNIRLSEEPIQRKEISYENINSPWDAFPAVKKEYLTPGIFIKATYQNYGEVRKLLNSTEESQKQNRIRLARLMLKLPKNYTNEDIKRHFREISTQYHPDKIPTAERNERTQTLSTSIMQLLGKARDILLEK